MASHYVATLLMVSGEEDTFENGCIPDTSWSNSETMKIFGEDLKTLIANIAAGYGVSTNDIQVEDDNTLRISRHERENGIVATESVIEQWKKGEVKLFLVDYKFSVYIEEAVIFGLMSAEEIKALGVER